jgi:general secretion pathway protein E
MVVANKLRVEEIAAAGLAPLAALTRVVGPAPQGLSAADLVRLTTEQIVEPDRLARFLADRCGLEWIDRPALDKRRARVDGLSVRFLRENWLLPLVDEADALVIGMLNPTDREPLEALEMVLQRPLTAGVVAAPDIEAWFEKLDQPALADTVTDAKPFASAREDANLAELASGAPVVMAVEDMFQRALDMRATDIHLEPMRNRLILRFRVDGVLRPVPAPPAEMAASMISRVKVLAGLDIAERRKPQDGGARLTLRDREIEVRVATLPSIHGETLVVRILHRSSTLLDIEGLGLQPRDDRVLRRLLEHSYGMILVAGPTGSGKTTTLAAALSTLNDPGRKIVTIEDPVEYQIPGIVQSQIQPAIGLTFSTAIRAFVRQDPDVILVGEIRDSETARAAIQAALTGHLVLSTIHANTAPAAFIRLKDLGVESYLLAGAVRGVIAQRLIRRLCDNCKRPAPITKAMLDADDRLARVGFVCDDPVHEAVGCDRCGGTGYRGRVAVFEMLPLIDETLTVAVEGADATRMEATALKDGMTTIADDSVAKARLGITSAAEVLRVAALR